MSRLGKWIKDHRLGRDMTQQQLADIVGCHSSYISQLERGISRNPGVLTVFHLADALSRNDEDRREFLTLCHLEDFSILPRTSAIVIAMQQFPFLAK